MNLISPVFSPQQSFDLHTRRRTLSLPHKQNVEKKALRFTQRTHTNPFHFQCQNDDMCTGFFYLLLFCLADLLLLPGSKAEKKNRGKPPEYQLTAATNVKSWEMQVQTYSHSDIKTAHIWISSTFQRLFWIPFPSLFWRYFWNELPIMFPFFKQNLD